MKIIILLLLVFSGCTFSPKDERPPLMNNNSFTNFLPMTNSIPSTNEFFANIEVSFRRL